ncbi:polypeptide N-acetylgalactosaminyltransferase 13-like protein, partial [Leptotrombidium deliense]
NVSDTNVFDCGVYCFFIKVVSKQNVKSAGFGGAPISVPENKQTVDEFFPKHYFNIFASDRLPLNRYPGEARIDGCLTKVYPQKLPTATVIIVFHNEAWSTLLRTLHSIIDTSPKTLLKEIILVDDMSTKVYLRRQLEDYVSKLECSVRILRQGHRLGLIQARLLGVSQAKGDVIVFLDSHIECNEGWLEPLLARIVEDRSRVVAPIIDVIDVNDFRVMHATPDIWGGFDWKISFRWNAVPLREMLRINYDRTEPLRTPTIAGGIFAIDKQFFKIMGEYDNEMKIWGAENLEISFRMWMCGGSLEIIPCSRIAHIFRALSPYVLMGAKDKVVQHNTARAVNVWLDEWKDFYYTLYPSAKLKVKPGCVKSRLAIREKFKCRSFRWYLENIYPESLIPRIYRYLGQVEHIKTGLCLDSYGVTNVRTAGIHTRQCFWDSIGIHPLMYQQTFMFTKDDRLIYDEFCLTFNPSQNSLLLETCAEINALQKWTYIEEKRRLQHTLSGLCLDLVQINSEQKFNVTNCLEDSHTQKWYFRNNFPWKLRS